VKLAGLGTSSATGLAGLVVSGRQGAQQSHIGREIPDSVFFAMNQQS
jgi:hypothetical protein